MINRYFSHLVLWIILFLVLIYFISRPNKCIQESFQTKKLPLLSKSKLLNRYKVSLIIPCIKGHAKFLPRLMRSVKKQTRPHYEILVSLSECTRKEGKDVSDQLNKIVPVKLYTTSAKKAKAETGRHEGARCDVDGHLLACVG